MERALADEVRMVRGCRRTWEEEERMDEGAVEDVLRKDEEEEGRGCRWDTVWKFSRGWLSSSS